MEASILIVSKNRKEELGKTLGILEEYINKDIHEILVFLDGCTDGSEELVDLYSWVKWEVSEKSLGASRARNVLYRSAVGTILFGFDDDAHPLKSDFIKITEKIFAENSNLGIIAFKEIKGIFASDEEISEIPNPEKEDYLVKDFLGCGFAIKKEVYEKTLGFPVWIDIYGEEGCVAIETLDLGYQILYTHEIAVHHRTDKQRMNRGGANYFRFEKQLKNTAYFYIVYFPFPLLLKKIGKLYYWNFKKYALRDWKYTKHFFYSLWDLMIGIRKVILMRQEVSKETILNFHRLANPKY